MSSRTRNITVTLTVCIALSLIIGAALKVQSVRAQHSAQKSLSKLGGTHTLQSAQQLRDAGQLPSRLGVLFGNPVTEIDLSVSSWPRSESQFPQVTDQDIAVISPLKHLERLTLRGMPITDVSIEQLIHFRRLQHLDIRDTEITADGVAKLRESLRYCDVKR